MVEFIRLWLGSHFSKKKLTHGLPIDGIYMDLRELHEFTKTWMDFMNHGFTRIYSN